MERRDGHQGDASAFKGARQAMAIEATSGAQGQRAAVAGKGHQENVREHHPAVKPPSEQSAPATHPSAVRLSVVGKNQAQPSNEHANRATQNASPEGFRGAVPRHWDRRRSDQAGSQSIIQMIIPLL